MLQQYNWQAAGAADRRDHVADLAHQVDRRVREGPEQAVEQRENRKDQQQRQSGDRECVRHAGDDGSRRLHATWP